jgi:hypothetical protein
LDLTLLEFAHSAKEELPFADVRQSIVSSDTFEEPYWRREHKDKSLKLSYYTVAWNKDTKQESMELIG